MRRICCGAALLLLSACGSGTTQEPAKAADTEAPSKPAEKSADPDSTSASESSSAAAKSSDSTSSSDAPSSSDSTSTLSGADLVSVLQCVLDDQDLDQYLHLEKHGRLPLKLVGPGLPHDIKLVKGSYPVTIEDAPSGKAPILVLTKIELDGKIATVVYKYDAEGVHGTSKVKNGKSGWELMSSRIVEH